MLHIMNSKSCLYIWGAHHILLLAAYLAHRYKLVSAVNSNIGEITYAQPYYITRKLFTALASILVSYVVIGRWLLGWRIYNWWAEALFVLITLALGHITFIAAYNTDQFTDNYTRLRRLYKKFTVIFIASFYVRLLLALLSLFSFSTSFSNSILPDIRYNDLYLFKNYYLSYSDAKGIVIAKRIFIFSKDISTLKIFTQSLCNFHGYDFTGDDAYIPFPFSTRTSYDVTVFTNPVQKKGYLNFTIDSSGRLKTTGFIYATTDAAIDATYMSCGTVYTK
jgi:hypothetical protein